MIEPIAALQFGNLSADILRSIAALDHGNLAQYQSSLDRAYTTLSALRQSGNPRAYEEGLLMLRGFMHAKARGTLIRFKNELNRLMVAFPAV